MRGVHLFALWLSLGGLGACALDHPEVRPNGAPCVDHRLCDSGLCLLERLNGAATGWTDGMCSERCAGACGPLEACVYLDSAAFCLPSCEAASEPCRDGYVCQPQLSACLPDCRLGWDCGLYLTCAAEDGLCRVPTAPGAAVGAPCAGPGDCATGLCLTESDASGLTGWSEGTCTAPCPDGACDDGACLRVDEYLLCVGACASGEPCREGYVCHARLGARVPDCRLGWSCGDALVCGEGGECEVARPDLLPLGAPCGLDIECATGLCLAETEAEGAVGWTGGMCAGLCGTASCGPDTGCVVLDGGVYCLPACLETSDCREGYVCSLDTGVCLPDCRLGWDCGDSFACGAQGECEPQWPSLAALGEPCDAHSDCVSGVCLVQFTGAEQTWFDGVCTVACAAGCPDGTVCVNLGGGSGGYCLSSCSGQSDCPDAYVCDPGRDACVPSCQLGWACPEGAWCNQGGFCRSSGS
jgi:hypothetical protein